MDKVLIEPGYALLNRKVIMPQKRSYLKDRGWIVKGDTYVGHYQTKHGAWKGKIERGLNSWEFYIYRPTYRLLNGDHAACFTSHNNGWYSIHWTEKPENPSDGIFGIEKIIEQSYVDPGIQPLPIIKQSWWKNLLGENE